MKNQPMTYPCAAHDNCEIYLMPIGLLHVCTISQMERAASVWTDGDKIKRGKMEFHPPQCPGKCRVPRFGVIFCILSTGHLGDHQDAGGKKFQRSIVESYKI